jgi:hypothetical protein
MPQLVPFSFRNQVTFVAGDARSTEGVGLDKPGSMQANRQWQGLSQCRTSSAIFVSFGRSIGSLQRVTDRYGTRIDLAVDRDLLNVTVSGSGRSKSECAESDDENVLSERRVKHGDRLSDGMMRCT